MGTITSKSIGEHEMTNEELSKIMNRNSSITDICQMTLECCIRIAMGQSKDPKKDAIETIRGCGIIASEELAS